MLMLMLMRMSRACPCQVVFNYIEWVSVILFSLEYVIRFLTCPTERNGLFRFVIVRGGTAPLFTTALISALCRRVRRVSQCGWVLRFRRTLTT